MWYKWKLDNSPQETKWHRNEQLYVNVRLKVYKLFFHTLFDAKNETKDKWFLFEFVKDICKQFQKRYALQEIENLFKSIKFWENMWHLYPLFAIVLVKRSRLLPWIHQKEISWTIQLLGIRSMEISDYIHSCMHIYDTNSSRLNL